MEAAERGGYPEVARLSTEASDVRGRLLAALKRDRFTAPLTEDELELIVKKMEQIKLSGTLLQEGEAAVKAFVIQEGFLTVSAHGRPLAVLRAGDCVGTAGVLRRSNAHSVATQPGEYAVVWSVDVAEISRWKGNFANSRGAHTPSLSVAQT
ncbi:unnamed protein product [Effrenium voratum]|nr:unnamed protein product [Effrenium voratum]